MPSLVAVTPWTPFSVLVWQTGIACATLLRHSLQIIEYNSYGLIAAPGAGDAKWSGAEYSERPHSDEHCRTLTNTA